VSLFRRWERSQDPIARRQRKEIVIGFLAFCTLAAFVNAVVAELRGKPALFEALLLLVLVAALALSLRSWRRMPDR
jgi:protein-S-isoprenylcysteine O-methyltransferase Ste14